MKINRSVERIKQTGEVFTPLPLVDEILSKLPEQVWDPSKTFVDPACGDGNFLVRVVAWKIWKGSTPAKALSTTYGVDIMPDNVSHARDRVLTNAWLAFQCKGQLLPFQSSEQERNAGMMPGHDAKVRKWNPIVEDRIVCSNAFEWDFENWCPKVDKQQQMNDNVLTF